MQIQNNRWKTPSSVHLYLLKQTSFALTLMIVLCAASNPPVVLDGKKISNAANPVTQTQSNGDRNCGTRLDPCFVVTEMVPQSQDDANNDAGYREERAADRRAFFIGISGIILGFVQAVALVITFLIMAFVANRQLRAYVVPSIDDIEHFSLTDPIRIRIEMKNVGQTPARDFESHGVVFVGALPLADDAASLSRRSKPNEPRIVGRHSKLTIYPGFSQMTVGECIDVLTPEIVEHLLADDPKCAIYVCDTAYYRDIFGLKRRTEVCRFIHSDDAKKLINIEKGVPIKNLVVRFVASHILNDFT